MEKIIINGEVFEVSYEVGKAITKLRDQKQMTDDQIIDFLFKKVI